MERNEYEQAVAIRHKAIGLIRRCKKANRLIENPWLTDERMNNIAAGLITEFKLKDCIQVVADAESGSASERTKSHLQRTRHMMERELELQCSLVMAINNVPEDHLREDEVGKDSLER